MHRTIWQTLLGGTLLGSVLLYFLLTSTYTPLHILDKPKETVAQDGLEFYNWTTATKFRQVSAHAAKNAPPQELCQSFPKDKLVQIQPVLKTGHGAMHRVRSQLTSSAACLDNLLIFSDMDEEIEGRPVIDTIADIPQRLLESDNQTLPYRHLKDFAENGTLDRADVTSLPGWETDKFKFLPDVSRAWRISPERRWYVFFEGDTFIVWDTVFRLLENFDADVPHYFGSPSPGRDATWFANGGPGFIVSRGAMRRLVKHDFHEKTGEYLGSKLSENHWHETLVNCCGDSILGWALWEEHVPLKGLWPMFNPHPPHGMPFSDLYWCQPVLSMHKPSEDDMEKFWRWEWEHRNARRPLLYRDMALSYYDSFQVSHREDWDNGEWDGFDPPDDYDPHASTSSCHTACQKHDGCFQWTYHMKRCYFVRSFRLGRAKKPSLEEMGEDGKKWLLEDRRFTAGWDTAKIMKWIEQRPCNEVQWVRPSISRIF